MTPFSLRTRGFALISAIFLLVVLGLLGFYLLSLSGTQQFTGLWAIQGARAHYAAQSGVQWGAFQAVTNGSGCTGSFDVDAGAPSPFTVEVSCSSASFTELGVETLVWTITANAHQGALGNPGFVQRTVRMTVAAPPPVAGP